MRIFLATVTMLCFALPAIAQGSAPMDDVMKKAMAMPMKAAPAVASLSVKLDGKVKNPACAAELVSLLDKKSPKNKSDPKSLQ